LEGGCIYEGPFANHAMNPGPITSSTEEPNRTDSGMVYNPRYRTRDINPDIPARFITEDDILAILGQGDIYDVQMNLQGISGVGIGAHGGGHYTLGMKMPDLFNSINGPAFFAHYGQVDRMWTVWQWLDLTTRQNAISGTTTYLNSPISANTTLYDTVDLHYSGGEVEGDFCYMYV
jgi:tyrosinase